MNGMNRNLKALVEGKGGDVTVNVGAALAVKNAAGAASGNAKAVKRALKVFRNMAEKYSEKDYSKAMMEIFDVLQALDKSAEAARLAAEYAGQAIEADASEASSLAQKADKALEVTYDVANSLK